MKVLVATRNRGKFQEIVRLLGPAGFTPVGLEDTGLFGEAQEHGKTYLENAAAKALYWSRQYEGPVLAEDSGLEVQTLGGKPGIHTARYGGPGLTDAQRIQKLLDELAAAAGADRQVAPTTAGAAHAAGTSRAAAYKCAAVLANGGTLIASFSGACQGEIAAAPRGSGGFGYDPIFLYPPLGKTFAELAADEKDKISHRGAALRALAEHLKKHGMSA